MISCGNDDQQRYEKTRRTTSRSGPFANVPPTTSVVGVNGQQQQHGAGGPDTVADMATFGILEDEEFSLPASFALRSTRDLLEMWDDDDDEVSLPSSTCSPDDGHDFPESRSGGRNEDMSEIEQQLQSLVLSSEGQIRKANETAISLMQVHHANRQATNILRAGIFELSAHVPNVYEDFLCMSSEQNPSCLFTENSLVALELPVPNGGLQASSGIDERAFVIDLQQSIANQKSGSALFAQVMVVMVYNMGVSNHREAVQDPNEINTRRVRLAKVFYDYCELVLQGYSNDKGEDHILLAALRTNKRHADGLLREEAALCDDAIESSVDDQRSLIQGALATAA